jgi:hypothetical protein
LNEPLSATLLKNRLAVPVLVAVIVWAALVVPFACDPKFSDVGESESAGDDPRHRRHRRHRVRMPVWLPQRLPKHSLPTGL